MVAGVLAIAKARIGMVRNLTIYPPRWSAARRHLRPARARERAL